MKIVSFNVNGIRAILTKNFTDIFSLLDADIFSLNETKFSEEEHTFFPFMPSGYYTYWTNSKIRKGYSGVAVYAKHPPLAVHYGLENGKYDDEGRVITLEYPHFYYVACYVPNAGEGLKRLPYRMEFENDMLSYLNQLKSRKTVIYGGDLNVAHQEIDLKNPKANMGMAGFTDEERAMMTRLIDNGFIDVFRYLYPESVIYSWWSYRFKARERNAGWRIDYFLVDEKSRDLIQNMIIHTEIYGSDHCPIEINVDLSWE